MKKLLLLAVIVLLAASTFAAEGKPVSYKSGDETVQGILYTPDRQRSVPRADRHSRMVGFERLGERSGFETR